MYVFSCICISGNQYHRKCCEEYFPLKVLKRIFSPAKFKKKYIICAWKLSLIKGRQTDRQTDRVSYRGAPLLKIRSLIADKSIGH